MIAVVVQIPPASSQRVALATGWRALVGWSVTKEAGAVGAGIIRLPAASGVACTGITFDNGKEFARPYHPWERGTNENTNGLIRRLCPKSVSFAAIGEADLKRIDVYLNNRPKKCPGWKTPREVMAASFAAAA